MRLRRALREEMYRAYITRASSGGSDNTPLIERTLALRREQAQLLGFPNYAEVSLARKVPIPRGCCAASLIMVRLAQRHHLQEAARERSGRRLSPSPGGLQGASWKCMSAIRHTLLGRMLKRLLPGPRVGAVLPDLVCGAYHATGPYENAVNTYLCWRRRPFCTSLSAACGAGVQMGIANNTYCGADGHAGQGGGAGGAYDI